MAETCSCILYIATNCNIVVFMTVHIYIYIYIYIYIRALYYRPIGVLNSVSTETSRLAHYALLLYYSIYYKYLTTS